MKISNRLAQALRAASLQIVARFVRLAQITARVLPVLPLLLLVPFAVGPAYALSASCEAINTKYGSGTTITSSLFETYDRAGFDGTETISWSISSPDGGADAPQVNFGDLASSWLDWSGPNKSSGSFSLSGLVGDLVVSVDSAVPDSFSADVTITCGGVDTAPALTGASPVSGPIAGGTIVTLSGTNLAGVTQVLFGTDAGAITSASATSVVVTTPAHAAGPVDVTVSDGTEISVLASGFTYTGPAYTISPASGALPNGTVGSVYSQGFYPSVYPGVYSITLKSGTLPDGLSLYDTPVGAVPNIAGIATTAGTFYFVIELKNAQAETVEASYSITISPPAPTFILTPPAGPLASGTYGQAYSQPFSVAGGTGPYSYQLAGGTLPEGLTLDADGSLHGSPAETGLFAFSIKVTDASFATQTSAYSLTVNAAPSPAIVMTPADGASLPTATAGEDYSASVTATGGTGPLIYSLSGNVPAGLMINATTGELTGPLGEGSEGQYSFTVKVSGNDNQSAVATYSLTVAAKTLGVTDKERIVPAGSTPTNVRLTEGASGGPFTDAMVAYVEPANAGTAQIVLGEFAASDPMPTDYYLKFTPNPAYSGKAVVGYRLVSALGVSDIGTVTYTLGFDPDSVATSIDSLVHGFLNTRQGLVASNIELPGLGERRALARSVDAVTSALTPGADGVELAFSSSLVQMNAAARAAEGLTPLADEQDPFNIWAKGIVSLHNRTQNDGRWGSFAMVSAGADYLITDRVLVGLSFHLDRMVDPSADDSELTGTGWLAGPYTSIEVGEGVFFNASLLYGGSDNDIDTTFFDGSFDTTRWMFDASLTGDWKIDEATTLTPRLRAVYLNESVPDYVVTNAAGTGLMIDGFTAEQFRLSLGAELKRAFALENGLVLTPSLGGTAGLAGLDDASLFGSVAAGLSLAGDGQWSLDTELRVQLDRDGARSAAARGGLKVRF